MKVAFVGIGKLGFPLAMTACHVGHEVVVFDSDEHQYDFQRRVRDSIELDPACAYAASVLRRATLDECLSTELTFVVVPTPHKPQYEGITPLPLTRANFDYRILAGVLRDLRAAYVRLGEPAGATVVVVSTALPGTLDQILHDMGGVPLGLHVLYNPSFCAMGTVMRDYRQPEFVLIGDNAEHDDLGRARLCKYYETVAPQAPVEMMSIASAELTKVAYNTFISAKIGIVNLLAQICHAVPGANVVRVAGALAKATSRICSPAYMRPGLGDGGACHPRDNIAMSWLAHKLHVSDVFGAIMEARQDHARSLAMLLLSTARERGKDRAAFLGIAYKPNVPLTDGSHAKLVLHYVHHLNTLVFDEKLRVDVFDPLSDEVQPLQEFHPGDYSLVFIGCAHDAVKALTLAPGTVVVDPTHEYPAYAHLSLVHYGVGPLGGGPVDADGRP